MRNRWAGEAVPVPDPNGRKGRREAPAEPTSRSPRLMPIALAAGIGQIFSRRV